MRKPVRFTTWPVMVVILFYLAPAFGDGMTLEDIARLEQAGQVAVSPDGSKIAYTRIVPRDLRKEDDGAAWTELHLVDARGESRPFISGQVNIRSIGWLPDSSAITFLDERSGDDHATLYKIPVTGGEARRVGSVATGVQGYSFSPDGEQVAVISQEPDSDELREKREQGFSQIIYEEDWKPRRVWILDRSNPDADIEPLDIDGSVQRVEWSPAGDRLAMAVTPRQLVDDTLMFQRLRIVDLDGEEIGRIENPGKLGDWSWSPDGAHIAFIGTETIHDTREGRLMVASGDGGQWANLLPDLAGHVWHVDWRSAGEIAFVSYEGVEARIGVIGPDGEGETTLLQEDGLIPESLSVADDGRIAFAATTVSYPREVHAFSDGQAERLTNSNRWLDERTLARQEVVTYTARDGLEIEGLLTWPLDYIEGERYPLILAVHGGPEAHYSNGWLTHYNLPAHHAAAEGYFMFYPNYRGSTGRGVDFALTSQGRPAAEEFDDLVDGVDHLIERGLVDGDRVGITGGSYGGYASAWGATYYTERFAAAVMNVGLSDKISMLGTSDIPQELYLVHYLTWPWEDWEMYRKASPIYYASQAQTPILILHGDADPRVDPTQSRILYRYLSLQDDPPPLRMVLYRGEGHSNQRAATRWDYSLRLMRWMDHYLKGEGGDPPDYSIDYGLD
ncbi:S9 family peptidase [Wenzhouxiangella sp. AB-CW3]|uniref:S9 family peptidase n=1 Tax=Wenzhouxiangella sp. AB-CW3 TaxID=2771012 RepID=UPI00168A976F|nr:S9 family peptidase [Wenzhouxiangella sp. AB-CW3]QOC21120.1 S9 family peptidase [Wenzhouxiangella sp. AB-CW3]